MHYVEKKERVDTFIFGRENRNICELGQTKSYTFFMDRESQTMQRFVRESRNIPKFGRKN